MKCAALLWGTGLGTLLAIGTSIGQTPTNVVPPSTLASTPQPWMLVLTNLSSAGAVTNLYYPGFGWQGQPTNRVHALPKPGVYKSAPYSCIVVVPPPHPDDRGILGSAGSRTNLQAGPPEFNMPVVRPELRLVPFTNR